MGKSSQAVWIRRVNRHAPLWCKVRIVTQLNSPSFESPVARNRFWRSACNTISEVIIIMIRVITADEAGSTTITVDGELSVDCLEAVETSCSQAISKGKPVLLYLRNVSMIDERGRALLQDLAAKGVVLKASGIYSSYIVDEIQSGRLDKRHPHR